MLKLNRAHDKRAWLQTADHTLGMLAVPLDLDPGPILAAAAAAMERDGLLCHCLGIATANFWVFPKPQSVEKGALIADVRFLKVLTAIPLSPLKCPAWSSSLDSWSPAGCAMSLPTPQSSASATCFGLCAPRRCYGASQYT